MAVRKAAIFCIAMVVMVVPPTDMFSDAYHMSDTMEFLQELIERDPDREIQEMSVQVISHLQYQLKKGLTNGAAET